MTQTLLITGASTGIGAATARAAAEAGWQVALLARSQDELDSLAGEIGERALALPCDVTDRAALNAAVDRAVDHFGGLDAVFANAGKGGLILWPLFGATNQLLAGLSFLVITFYLWRRGRTIWFLVIPTVFMLIMPLWAMIHQLFVAPGWLVAEQPNYLLGGIGLATIALEIWMIVEAVKLFPRVKGVIEENALDRQPA
mgnify:CR=1 FL=1